ncbi:MAG: 6-phosphogluconolactonase [Chloroflexota bacterium]|nr:MAG: 6-phosphogluconolactonase [Chloroflexota bacterium]
MSSIPEIRIFDGQMVLSEAAAELIVETAANSIRERGRFMLALSGGSTPAPVYRMLAGPGYVGRLPWLATHLFWGDERCVPPDDPGSNYGQARRLLLGQVPMPEEQIHRIKGELGPDDAATEYRALLAELAGDGLAWPRMDLAIMGLGSDGHTASLFPGPAAPDENHLAAIGVSAEYDGRPAQRVTLTPPVFNIARNVLFLVTGAKKTEAVKAVLGGGADSERWPAARIKLDSGRLLWYLDRPAATLIS